RLLVRPRATRRHAAGAAAGHGSMPGRLLLPAGRRAPGTRPPHRLWRGAGPAPRLPRRADEGHASDPVGRPGAPVPAQRDHVPRRPELGPFSPPCGGGWREAPEGGRPKTMTARAPYDVVVVGLGLAGLVAGLAAASRGASVLVAGKG